MFKDLIGDLSALRLYDLLKPLVDEKKSGLLSVKGSETTEIYLEGGLIVHARTGARVGEEALPFIMDLDNGRVSFDWRSTRSDRTLHQPTEQIMSRWASQEEAWRMIRLVVPSVKTVFSLVVESGGRDRLIPANRWEVLALCNGQRNVSTIAAQLGRNVFEVAGTLRDLVLEGMIREEAVDLPLGEAGTAVDEAFFDAAEQELKKVLGPIARIILNDTLAAFEESRQAFPKERVKSFISTVCDQIPEEGKREKFGKAAYLIWFSSFENR